MAISMSKNYNNLRFYLQRVHKIKNSGTLASFLLEKFCSSKNPTGYVKIFIDELRNHGVLEKNEKLYDFREEMTKKFILVCKADEISLKDKEANFKASEFKYGKSIQKYIERGLDEKSSIYEKLDLKADLEDLDLLEKRMEDRLSQAATQDQIADLNLKIHDLEGLMETLLLEALPPDDETRREIIRANKYDKKDCIRLLKENSEKGELK